MIPAEIILNPNWWFRNYGIAFDQPFYFDKDLRIANDVAMRRAMHQRFGLGDPNPQPRPVAGSMFVAGGFVIPALFGVEVRFAADQAPWPVPRNLDRDALLALDVPDIETTWPMSRLSADMDALEREYGRVKGDFDVDGVLNTALLLRGEQIFVDLLEDSELTGHLFSVIARTQASVAAYVRSRTGTSSISVNRSIVSVDARIFVHSNCTVQMISPAVYRAALLQHELYLAGELAPYGIHHCGNNLHRFAGDYARTHPSFVDVGWGSDVAASSAALPDAFLNLRLSPVRMLQRSPAEIRSDAEQLLVRSGRRAKVGLCCINMDYGTPDENVRAMLDVARDFG